MTPKEIPMTTLHRTVRADAPPDLVFAYLVDFRNATEWDSGTVSCERVSGEGGPGTVYRNVSRFAGRTVELDYTVESVKRPRFVVVGRNASTTSRDTITVTPDGAGSVVDYAAEFTFAGPARFLGPLMSPLLNRLGDQTEETLRTALATL
jgi:uncharacterized protein YndB with AHSA1/START domain